MKRVRTVFTGVAGTPYYSNLYFADEMDAQDAVDEVKAFWDICAEFMVNDCAFSVDGTVVTIDPTTGEITGSFAASGDTGQGTSTTEMLPRADQLLVQWPTGVYVEGRQARGRTFVPALADFNNDEGVVATATLTTLTTNLTTWLAANPFFLIWSKKAGLSNVPNSVAVWNQFAILRSRRD